MGRLTYKDPIKGLGVVCRCKTTTILQMAFQVPELLQSHSRNIDDIAGLRDGNMCVRAIIKCRTEREDETSEVLV